MYGVSVKALIALPGTPMLPEPSLGPRVMASPAGDSRGAYWCLVVADLLRLVRRNLFTYSKHLHSALMILEGLEGSRLY